MTRLNGLQNTKLTALRTCTAAALAATPVSTPIVAALGIAEQSCSAETAIQASVTSSQSTPDEKILDAIAYKGQNPLDLYASFSTPNEKPSFATIIELGKELFDLVIPRARADFQLSMLGLSAVAIGVVVKLMKASWPLLDRQMAIPLHRGIAFTAAGILAGGSGAMSKKLEGQMAENQEKVDLLIEKMKINVNQLSLAEGSLSGKDGNLNLGAQASVNNALNLGLEGQRFPCPGEWKMRDGQCISIEDSVSEGFQWEQFGGALKSSALMGTQAADGILGADSLGAGTLEKIEGLMNNAVATRSELDRMMAFTNDQSKKVGLGENDFVKAADNFISGLTQAKISTLKDERISPSAMMAAWANPNWKPSEDLNQENNSEENKEVASALSETIKPKAETANNKKDEEFIFEFRDSGPTTSSGSLERDHDGRMLVSIDDNYEVVGRDIVENREVSIFTVITTRYFMSGYPRLFDLIDQD